MNQSLSNMMAKSEDKALLGVVGCVYGVIIAIALTFGIVAIVIADKYGNDQCVGSYAGISFSYGTWLLVFGAIKVVMCFVSTILVIASVLDKSGCSLIVTYIVGALGMGFDFAFYIVGSILFFNEVNSTNCSTEQPPLQQFGLALFIIQTIMWSCVILGASRKAESERPRV
jgi:hypothetical protein